MPPHEPHSLDARLPSAELANLSLSRDVRVRAAVAAHPNTSASILGTLAAEFPAEVLGNPALPLLRLAQPGLVLRWPVAAVRAVLGLPDTPDWLLRQVRDHPAVEIHVALASHPRLSPSGIEALSAHVAWLVRARIAARPDLSSTLLHRLLLDPDDSVRLAVASRTDLRAADRTLLRRDPSRFVQQTLRATRGRPQGT